MKHPRLWTALVVVLVVVAGGAIAYVNLDRSGVNSEQVPVVAARETPYRITGADLTTGSGPKVVDVYYDYLCPFCRGFEQAFGERLRTGAAEGRLTVRYHPRNLLDEVSEPRGYSLRAANAALCAAQAGRFDSFTASLFAAQPAEFTAGYSDAAMTELAGRLGAPDIGRCIAERRNADAVAAALHHEIRDPVLLAASGRPRFSTPLVLVDGRGVDLSSMDTVAASLG